MVELTPKKFDYMNRGTFPREIVRPLRDIERGLKSISREVVFMLSEGKHYLKMDFCCSFEILNIYINTINNIVVGVGSSP